MEEPRIKRAVAFFDGQNLFRHAKDAFGYHHPNYDPQKLFNHICSESSWENCGIRFYTGTPSLKKSEMWHGYWSNRLLAMRRSGILVEDRPLRYREQKITLRDGTSQMIDVCQEKGIDIRIALDLIRLTLQKQLDVAVIFSQDQDLAEAVKEAKEIARIQNRWIWIASAFPYSKNATSTRGIDKTDWIKIDRTVYDDCLDPKDYRPTKFIKSRKNAA